MLDADIEKLRAAFNEVAQTESGKNAALYVCSDDQGLRRLPVDWAKMAEHPQIHRCVDSMTRDGRMTVDQAIKDLTFGYR